MTCTCDDKSLCGYHQELIRNEIKYEFDKYMSSKFESDIKLMVRTWIAGSVCRHDINTRNCGLCMIEQIKNLLKKV